MSASPAEPAGTMQVIFMSLLIVRVVQATPPIVTVLSFTNPLPVIAILVPPVADPYEGFMDAMIGEILGFVGTLGLVGGAGFVGVSGIMVSMGALT